MYFQDFCDENTVFLCFATKTTHFFNIATKLCTKDYKKRNNFYLCTEHFRCSCLMHDHDKEGLSSLAADLEPGETPAEPGEAAIEPGEAAVESGVAPVEP